MNDAEKGGIGWLFFAAIPAVLAGAALMWLAFYTGVIDWKQTQRIEGRMDARVGIRGELTAPVDLIIKDKSCLHITKAFLDGGTLTSYVTSACKAPSGYWELRWRAVAPDGTIIASGYNNTAYLTELDPGETTEHTDNLPDNERISKVIVWTLDHPR